MGNCAHSDKPGKKIANRAERKIVKQILKQTLDDTLLPQTREIADGPYDFPKDGKSYFGPGNWRETEFYTREDYQENYDKHMRK